MTITIEEMKAEVEAKREEIDKGIKDEGCPEFLVPLFEAGHWLGEKLTAAGVDDQTRKGICFAMGQRCLMQGGARNAYRVAIETFDRWRRGDTDTPGLEFAQDLIDHTKHKV